MSLCWGAALTVFYCRFTGVYLVFEVFQTGVGHFCFCLVRIKMPLLKCIAIYRSDGRGKFGKGWLTKTLIFFKLPPFKFLQIQVLLRLRTTIAMTSNFPNYPLIETTPFGTFFWACKEKYCKFGQPDIGDTLSVLLTGSKTRVHQIHVSPLTSEF